MGMKLESKREQKRRFWQRFCQNGEHLSLLEKHKEKLWECVSRVCGVVEDDSGIHLQISFGWMYRPEISINWTWFLVDG